jgi:CAP-Gly domain-containing linker protein 1
MEIQDLSTVTSLSSVISMNGQDSSANTCEICEQPGHDIFTCPVLQGEKAAKNTTPSSHHHFWCEDCERPGHIAADCPHSLDVF